MITRQSGAVIVLSLLFASNVAAEIDDATGLVIDQHWELVYANCVACHSLRLVIAQRASRQTWRDLIRWMQRTQNFWALEPDVESGILDYLTKHYGPEPGRRRAPIPRELMPEGSSASLSPDELRSVID